MSSVIKCKMCGGDLDIPEGLSVAECEYCGSKQTVPNRDDEKKLTLFGRANRLRFACEFDKAAGVYESIVADFPEEAEAYWGLVLCRYGIEYVDDPKTGKKIPTCHRSSFDSVMDDTDFEQACENADAVVRKVYREEAKVIDELRKSILEVSGKEEPYDIFICYKETADNGERTIDSVIAQDVYDALTEKGYRVFFSRISLEDKLGTEYEPYIFAALNSAKVMLVFGTDYEYFNAVWVKNEWSRFLALIAAGGKKTLIPCYKGIDAYDMPKEFARLQAQDMGKVGAIQDLVRGVEKIISVKSSEQPVETAQFSGGPSAASLLKRGYIFLSDGDWKKADEYFEKVLDIDPENGDAYAGKFCALMKYKTLDELGNTPMMWDSPAESEREKYRPDRVKWESLQKVEKYASPALKTRLAELIKKAYDATIQRSKEEARKRAEEENRRLALKGAIQKASKWNILDTGYSNIYTTALCSNGKRISTNDQVSEDAAAVASRGLYKVELFWDGTVVTTNKYNKDKVSTWRDIVAIACSDDHTVGLRSDGTVVTTGDNTFGQSNVSDWRNIIAIACGTWYTVGLRSDGTVVAVGDNEYGQCCVKDWQNIIAIACSEYCTVGLRSDGTVVATGGNKYERFNLEGWHNIVAIACGRGYTVGLCSDGMVVATGDNESGQCNVGDWRDIIAIACGDYHTVGLRSDGTVVATGDNKYGQCNVKSWKLFDSVEQLERDMTKRIKKEILALKTELANLHGLFTGKRRKELQDRIELLEERIRNL